MNKKKALAACLLVLSVSFVLISVVLFLQKIDWDIHYQILYVVSMAMDPIIEKAI